MCSLGAQMTCSQTPLISEANFLITTDTGRSQIPGLAWGLYDKKRLSRLKGLEIKDKGIEYFIQKNLEEMSTTRTEKLIDRPVDWRRYAAFPWMVAEIKQEFGSEKERIWQAANASHTSLVLSERLAARANMDALPIVAFTYVGPKAEIFIAYKANDELYVDPTLISRECCP